MRSINEERLRAEVTEKRNRIAAFVTAWLTHPPDEMADRVALTQALLGRELDDALDMDTAIAARLVETTVRRWAQAVNEEPLDLWRRVVADWPQDI